MARMILLVACGATLLFCPSLATLAASGGNDDGSFTDDLSNLRPLTPHWTSVIEQGDERISHDVEQEEERISRHTNPFAHGKTSGDYGPDEMPSTIDSLKRNPSIEHSQPEAHSGYQSVQTLPGAYQVHLSQPKAYSSIQPVPAVQPQPSMYTVYQPAPAVQPQPEPYPVYQPASVVQSQPSMYPVYQQAPAVQPQPSMYTVYQPAPAVQPQPEAYPVYQQVPAVQPQPEAYPVYQPAPAVQPQPEAYPVYQQAPAVQPQPSMYTVYQPAPAVQPQPEPYPVYQQAPAVQPQPSMYTVYQPAPAVQPQPEAYPVYQPAPAVQPQPSMYTVYQPAPVVQPQAVSYQAPQLAPATQTIQISQPVPVAQTFQVSQPAPVAQTVQVSQPAPQAAVSLGQSRHMGYQPPTMPGQSYVVVRYIPGLVSRKYRCRQKVECGWKYRTTPGRYVYIRYFTHRNPVQIPPRRIVYFCPRQQCTTVHQPCNLSPPAVNYRPTQPPSMCTHHNQCSGGQYCCYGSSSPGMMCQPGTAMPLRHQRHLQLNSTVTGRSRVELVIGQWKNNNVTDFVTDMLLPLKVDLETDMEVILHPSDPTQRQFASSCVAEDTDCIAPRILSCVSEMWPSVSEPLTDENTVPGTVPFIQSSPFAPMTDHQEEQQDPDVVEPITNTTGFVSEEEILRLAKLEQLGGDDEVVEVDPVASAAHARQVQHLSFAACLLQSFVAGVVERKKSALLAAKRCVRAYKLDWQRVRRCAARRGQGLTRGGRQGQHSPVQKPPLSMTVNGVPVPELDNIKLALCQALLTVGQAPLLCDLLYDQLDEQDHTAKSAMTDPTGVWGTSNPNNEGQALEEADRGQGRAGEEQRGGGSSMRSDLWEREENEEEEESDGFSMNRVSQNLNEIQAGRQFWSGARGEPYEV